MIGGEYYDSPISHHTIEEEVFLDKITPRKVIGVIEDGTFRTFEEYKKYKEFSGKKHTVILSGLKRESKIRYRLHPPATEHLLTQEIDTALKNSIKKSTSVVMPSLNIIGFITGFMSNVFEDRYISGYREYLELEKKVNKNGWRRLTNNEAKKLFDYGMAYDALEETPEGREELEKIKRGFDASERIRIMNVLRENERQVRKKIKKEGGYMSAEGIYRPGPDLRFIQ